MRDRNIFDQLPIEEISEETVPLSNSVEPDSKRNSHFRRRPKKIKTKPDEFVQKEIEGSNIVEEFNNLSIDNLEVEEENFMDSEVGGRTERKKFKCKRFNNVENKKKSGEDNWKAYLKSKKTTQPEEVYEGSVRLNNDYRDEMASRKNLNCVAMDCEMVGTGADKKGNMLARVSIVNALGECIYDTFVKPTTFVTDYRTSVSGVRPADLSNAPDFHVVRNKVLEILRGKILVGHAVHNDLIVLDIRHPWYLTRDTSRYKKFYEIGFGTPSLKRLTSVFLNVEIQNGEHNSIQDAQATMQLYMLYRKQWEEEIRQHRANRNRYRSSRRPKAIHKGKKKHKR